MRFPAVLALASARSLFLAVSGASAAALNVNGFGHWVGAWNADGGGAMDEPCG